MPFASNFVTPVAGGAVYNTREAMMWVNTSATAVAVYFVSQPNKPVVFDREIWEAALRQALASGT